MYACPELVVSFPAAPKLTQFNLNNRFYTHELYPSGKWRLVVLEGYLLKGIKRASGVFSSITEVEFRGCSSLKSCQLDFLPHFSKFTIRRCLDLESICIRGTAAALYSYIPRIQLSDKSEISGLQGASGLQQLTSLGNLMIRHCPKLEFIPEKSLPSSIEHLEIVKLKDLDYKGLQHLTSLRQLQICCTKLQNIPEESLPSSLEDLEIWSLKDLDCKGLQHLTSLRQLKISGCPNLESLPEEGLPSSLQYLEIWGLENLKSLNYKGLQHLKSIRSLLIIGCPKLESMPEQGLPSSLELLQIIDCPSLEKRVSSPSARLPKLFKLNKP
ncbi:unnamed protein product [Dovyalis caffra]|uniref:Uncharacterized protein n=1 Tax=Dovyalis caffra TaxID=77055 RepID=A0AAV1QRP0_9ROSI|nr:unnamed protein product [Dovyalis caffra]